MASISDVLEGPRQSRSGDHQCRRIQLTNSFADGSYGSRASRAVLPTTAAESSLYRFELQACSHPRTLDALRGDLAVAEEPLAERDAAHLQTFKLQRRQPVTDDELSTAA